MCLFVWMDGAGGGGRVGWGCVGGVSTALHTLSGPLTGSENYLASLEIFDTAESDNRKLCRRNERVYTGALKWRQNPKQMQWFIHKCDGELSQPQLGVRLRGVQRLGAAWNVHR